MALQDLTPQLRTRLSRLERFVGMFVTLAVILFLAGFAYYVYKTGQRKGWFLVKMPYFTYVDDAAGLNVGDDVMLMGFKAGKIIKIEAMPPFHSYNVYVAFEVYEPYFGYLWKDSRASVAPASLLGGRVIEVTKGEDPYPIPSYIDFDLQTLTVTDAMAVASPSDWVFNDTIYAADGTNLVVKIFQPVTEETLRQLQSMGADVVHLINHRIKLPKVSAIFVDQLGRYTNFTKDTKGYMLPPDESPALTERAEQVVGLVENSLPNILDLTNKLAQVLTNASALTARANGLLADIQPAATNLVSLTSSLREPDGALGRWLLSTNLLLQIESTLASAQSTATHADEAVLAARTNVDILTSNLVVNLQNLAGITSNLNAQVQANDFILSDVSELVRATDDMVQGMKRHWLLKGAFDSSATNMLPASILEPSLGAPP